jgi:hypothetical protein
MEPIEWVFIGLLVVVTAAIAWFAGFVVYRLYKGQH